MSETIPEGTICEYGCGQPATHQFGNGKYCCKPHNSKCPAQKEKILKSYKQSCLEIYGVENAFQSPVVQAKYKQTCLDTYGVENPMQLKELQDKHWETRRINTPPKPRKIKINIFQIYSKFERNPKCKFCGAPAIYQFKNGGWCCKTSSSSCPVVQEKQSKGWTDEVEKKRKQNMLKKYGVESVMHVEGFKEKKDETMIDRYGTKVYAKTPQFKDSLIDTHFGDKNHAWRGGVSFAPYCAIWQDKEYKEDIKKRDGKACQNCGITEQLSWIVYGRGLCIHHINYDKQDCGLINLITTCVSCNAKANTKRSEWQVYYEKIITERIYPCASNPIN